MTKINHNRWQLKLSDNQARELAKEIDVHFNSADPIWPSPLRAIRESQRPKIAMASFFEEFGKVLEDWNNSDLRDALRVAAEALLATKAFDPYENRMTVGEWFSTANPEAHPMIEISQKTVEFSRSGTWKA